MDVTKLTEISNNARLTQAERDERKAKELADREAEEARRRRHGERMRGFYGDSELLTVAAAGKGLKEVVVFWLEEDDGIPLRGYDLGVDYQDLEGTGRAVWMTLQRASLSPKLVVTDSHLVGEEDDGTPLYEYKVGIMAVWP